MVAIAITALLALAAVSYAALRLRWQAHRLREQVAVLRQQMGVLQKVAAGRPAPRVGFEFDASSREVLLHVTNDGADAEMWAPMSVEGALATGLAPDVRAVWVDGANRPANPDGSTAMIRRGEIRTLRLAQLDLSVFPYAQWRIFALGRRADGPYAEVLSRPAMHTSMIGGDPATHAPSLFLQVVLLSAPDAGGPPVHCTIALQAFDAVRLRG
jgi:hypothetical protein